MSITNLLSPRLYIAVAIVIILYKAGCTLGGGGGGHLRNLLGEGMRDRGSKFSKSTVIHSYSPGYYPL